MNSPFKQLDTGEGTIFRDLLCRPLFVSPSDSAPSEEIVPYLDLLFPNVPERAKQNNVLLKREELNYIEPCLNQVRSEYDVTIVIDQGARIENQVRSKLKEIGSKARVNCAFLCCILTGVNCYHEHAATELAMHISRALGDWFDLVYSWGSTRITLMSGPVTDFYRSYTHVLGSSREQEVSLCKEGDSSFIDIYSKSLCNALGMSAVPSFVIKSANSNDIRKLLHDCISWLAGSYLQVNTVIGVNNSPDTWSVDILHFDATVDNLLRLGSLTTSPVTKEALLLLAKMKTSIFVLQLRISQYLLDTRNGPQEDVDSINRHVADDILLAQSLCPHLGIKNLEWVPRLDLLTMIPFSADIRREIEHYQSILNRPEIHGLRTQLQLRDAVVCATYAIVHDTRPRAFGPISAQYGAPEGLTLLGRAVCTLMGTNDVILTVDNINKYLRGLNPEKNIMDEEIEHSPIELDWINDPHALAIDQGIPPNQLTQANYNPDTTLNGRIKFRYIRLEGLREIARIVNASDQSDDVSILAWNILKKKRSSGLIDQNNPAPERFLRFVPVLQST